MMWTTSGGLIPMSIARLPSRRSDLTQTANLAQTLDHLNDKTRQLPKKNQKLVEDVGAVGSRLAEPGEARTNVKEGKSTTNIAAWIALGVRGVLA